MTTQAIQGVLGQAVRRPGTILAAIILVWGACVSVVRFVYGLGAVTNMSDTTPWGFWVGFDVLCGVALAAGGFSITALVHLFGFKKLHPILPSTVMTAFLGYLLVSVGLIYDLGKPYNMWHIFVMHNPRSVMFEVAWCVVLYTTVLSIEFSTIVVQRFRWRWAFDWLSKLTIPAVLAGVLLSTLHQSSLGSVFLIVPGKLYKLWYTPYLPVMFFFSALTVGFAMVIVESYLSACYFRRSLEKDILQEIARFLLVTVVFYLGLKVEDLYARGMLGALFEPRLETWCFWLEMALPGLAAAMLAIRRVRASGHASFLCATMVVLGVVINRLNVSMVGTRAASGSTYLPSFGELSISVFLVTAGVIAFGLAVRFLGIFEHHDSETCEETHS